MALHCQGRLDRFPNRKTLMSPPVKASNVAKTARRTAASRRSSPQQDLAELKRRLLEISDLHGAGAVLGWDHATYMPEGGADARGRQGALLYRLAHERM